jgi:phosphoribulokinase
MFKNTNIGIAFRTTTTLHRCKRLKKQTPITDHERSGVYKITCNICRKAYVGQTGRNLKARYQEHTRYIKNDDPRSAYALHILNNRHEYGNINDTMTLLNPINKPHLLLLFEQMYIQTLYHNNELIPEQHPNEKNPLFELLQHKHLTSHST